MAFRADEAAQAGLQEVEAYFVPRPRDADESVRARSRKLLLEIIGQLGPVVSAYPTWHPLVATRDHRHPTTTPSEGCGYMGLDHTRYFVNGFITCPYGDGQAVIDSANALSGCGVSSITAERLDETFYSDRTTPILVKCDWDMALEPGGMIPLRIAMPLILEHELPSWRWAEVGETWESMRPYLLGKPHGSRSSLFVSQETGQAIKTIWNALINTEMFGPVHG